jgi:hypothetical protein
MEDLSAKSIVAGWPLKVVEITTQRCLWLVTQKAPVKKGWIAYFQKQSRKTLTALRAPLGANILSHFDFQQLAF